jgi:hypothetical protein
MKSSQSRIAKAEANHHSVSLDLLIRSLFALGASVEELGRILSAGESAGTLRKAAARQKPHRKQGKKSGNATKKSRVSVAKSSVANA